MWVTGSWLALINFFSFLVNFLGDSPEVSIFDLSRGRHRKVHHKVNSASDPLLLNHPLVHIIFDKFLAQFPFFLVSNDKRENDVVALVLNPDDAAALHTLDLVDDRLDLERCASDVIVLQHVLHAIDHKNEAIVVEVADIAGVAPAVGVKSQLCGFGVVVVAGEGHGRLKANLATRVRAQILA